MNKSTELFKQAEQAMQTVRNRSTDLEYLPDKIIVHLYGKGIAWDGEEMDLATNRLVLYPKSGAYEMEPFGPCKPEEIPSPQWEKNYPELLSVVRSTADGVPGPAEGKLVASLKRPHLEVVSCDELSGTLEGVLWNPVVVCTPHVTDWHEVDRMARTNPAALMQVDLKVSTGQIWPKEQWTYFQIDMAKGVSVASTDLKKKKEMLEHLYRNAGSLKMADYAVLESFARRWIGVSESPSESFRSILQQAGTKKKRELSENKSPSKRARLIEYVRSLSLSEEDRQEICKRLEAVPANVGSPWQKPLFLWPVLTDEGHVLIYSLAERATEPFQEVERILFMPDDKLRLVDGKSVPLRTNVAGYCSHRVHLKRPDELHDLFSRSTLKDTGLLDYWKSNEKRSADYGAYTTKSPLYLRYSSPLINDLLTKKQYTLLDHIDSSDIQRAGNPKTIISLEAYLGISHIPAEALTYDLSHTGWLVLKDMFNEYGTLSSEEIVLLAEIASGCPDDFVLRNELRKRLKFFGGDIRRFHQYLTEQIEAGNVRDYQEAIEALRSWIAILNQMETCEGFGLTGAADALPLLPDPLFKRRGLETVIRRSETVVSPAIADGYQPILENTGPWKAEVYPDAVDNLREILLMDAPASVCSYTDVYEGHPVTSFHSSERQETTDRWNVFLYKEGQNIPDGIFLVLDYTVIAACGISGKPLDMEAIQQIQNIADLNGWNFCLDAKDSFRYLSEDSRGNLCDRILIAQRKPVGSLAAVKEYWKYPETQAWMQETAMRFYALHPQHPWESVLFSRSFEEDDLIISISDQVCDDLSAQYPSLKRNDA